MKKRQLSFNVGQLNNKMSTPLQKEKSVLRVIRDLGEVSRSDLVKLTGLSAPTVTRITDTLISQHLVSHKEYAESTGGRPAELLCFESKNNYVIGIEIGGNYVRAALSDLDREFVFEIQKSFEVGSQLEEIIEIVGVIIQNLVARAQKQNKKLLGIGIAICGIVDKNTEEVVYSPVLDWKNINLKNRLKQYTDLPISIGNVANLIAQGELYYGLGKTFSNFVAINLEYGIGAGIVVDNNLIFGIDGFSGEIGHTIVQLKGARVGREGLAGSLEAYASTYGILDVVNEAIKSGEQTVLTSISRPLMLKDVISAAGQGDDLSVKVIDEAASYLGLTIDFIVKLLNPEAIVLSGGLSIDEKNFVSKVRNVVHDLGMNMTNRAVQVLVTNQGDEAALVGAFSLILSREIE